MVAQQVLGFADGYLVIAPRLELAAVALFVQRIERHVHDKARLLLQRTLVRPVMAVCVSGHGHDIGRPVKIGGGVASRRPQLGIGIDAGDDRRGIGHVAQVISGFTCAGLVAELHLLSFPYPHHYLCRRTLQHGLQFGIGRRIAVVEYHCGMRCRFAVARIGNPVHQEGLRYVGQTGDTGHVYVGVPLLHGLQSVQVGQCIEGLRFLGAVGDEIYPISDIFGKTAALCRKDYLSAGGSRSRHAFMDHLGLVAG